jgi:type I restriction enzyme S subunit
VGVSYPAINTTKLSSIKIAFTSKLEEQLLITKEVAHINQQIGMLISKAQNQIKIIRKYRQSLIYELVTGIRKP